MVASSTAKTIIGIYFDYEEKTSGYLNMLKSALETNVTPKRKVTGGRMSYNTLGGEPPITSTNIQKLNIIKLLLLTLGGMEKLNQTLNIEALKQTVIILDLKTIIIIQQKPMEMKWSSTHEP